MGDARSRWSMLVAGVAIVMAAGGAPVLAATAPPDVTQATLDNGLRVLVLEDHRNPVVSVQVWYRVGSRNERLGATGLAHFLEHMMFKGTPRHGKGAFARLVEQNGGHDNAFTTQDVTSYFVDIASDKVDMVLGLEPDRMRRLLLDPSTIPSASDPRPPRSPSPTSRASLRGTWIRPPSRR